MNDSLIEYYTNLIKVTDFDIPVFKAFESINGKRATISEGSFPCCHKKSYKHFAFSC